jgi:hypothetical protein
MVGYGLTLICVPKVTLKGLDDATCFAPDGSDPEGIDVEP